MNSSLTSVRYLVPVVLYVFAVNMLPLVAEASLAEDFEATVTIGYPAENGFFRVSSIINGKRCQFSLAAQESTCFLIDIYYAGIRFYLRFPDKDQQRLMSFDLRNVYQIKGYLPRFGAVVVIQRGKGVGCNEERSHIDNFSGFVSRAGFPGSRIKIQLRPIQRAGGFPVHHHRSL